jgi:hypothetical protein
LQFAFKTNRLALSQAHSHENAMDSGAWMAWLLARVRFPFLHCPIFEVLHMRASPLPIAETGLTILGDERKNVPRNAYPFHKEVDWQRMYSTDAACDIMEDGR